MGGSGGGSGGAIAKDPPWWEASWSKRVQLTIDNSGQTELANGFEVGFPIDPTQLFGSAGSALAISRYDSASKSWTLRPFHVEQAGGKSWVWTPLPSSLGPGGSDTSLWLYAGSPSPPSSNPAAVFTFWDGFDSVTGEWYAFGAPSFSGGKLVLANQSSIRSKTLVASGYAVDFAMLVDQPVSPPWDWICGGLQRVVDFDNTEPWLLWISREATTVQPEAKVSSVVDAVGAVHGLTLADNRIYGMERFPTRMVYRKDNANVESISWTTPYTTNLQMRFNAQSATGKATFDFVRVRRASYPPPAVALGTAEAGP